MIPWSFLQGNLHQAEEYKLTANNNVENRETLVSGKLQCLCAVIQYLLSNHIVHTGII